MSTGHAPPVATWLLRRFGCSPNNESVIGDILERYQHGRSRLWYWRQVISAIVASFFSEVRTNKTLAVVALVAGHVLRLSLWYLYHQAVGYQDFLERQSEVILLVYGAILICCARVVARTSSSHFKAIGLLYFFSEIVVAPVAEFIGGTFKLPLGIHISAIPIWQSFDYLLSRFGYVSTVVALWLTVGFIGLCVLYGGGLLTTVPPDHSPEATGPASRSRR